MSYKSQDLSVLAYANNSTLWHYTTADTSILENGYLNAAIDLLRVNDLIIANIDTHGSPKTVFYIVTSNHSGFVTITPLTA